MKIKKREAKEEAIYWGGELTQEVSEFFTKRLWQSVTIEGGTLEIITPSECRYIESGTWIICNSLDEELLFMPNEDFRRHYFIAEDGEKEIPVVKAEENSSVREINLSAFTFRAETKEDALNIAMSFLDSGGYRVIIESVKEFATTPFFKMMYEIRVEVINEDQKSHD